MKTFEIEVHEILSRVIRIEAESQSDALLKVKEMYRNEEIVLDADDYKETEIMPFIDESKVETIIQNIRDKDERVVLSEILQFIGITKDKSNIIAAEAGSSQEIVNENYLIEVGIPSFSINKAMKYINMFYRGEFSAN